MTPAERVAARLAGKEVAKREWRGQGTTLEDDLRELGKSVSTPHEQTLLRVIWSLLGLMRSLQLEIDFLAGDAIEH